VARRAREGLVLDDTTADWTPVDSLVIGRYQSYSLSYTGDRDVARSRVLDQVQTVFGGADATSAADRFARASFLLDSVAKKAAPSYIASVPGQAYGVQALASVLAVMRSVSVPLGITSPDKPNLGSTIWRTVADQRNLVYAFDSAVRPNAFWVRLAALDLKPGAPVRKLPMVGGEIYAGEVSGHFIPAKPFAFLPATGHKPG
jgi:hypothetical protein